MTILLKKCNIVDPESKYHGKKLDILIEKGTITKIAQSITSKKAKTISSKNLFVSPGWVDIGVHSGEPGLEQRDILETTLQAAAAGGYTRIGLFSNDENPFDKSANISFVNERSAKSAVHCHTIGALSQGLGGEEIAELMDMHHAGSIAFSDGLHSIQKAGLLERALHYVKAIDSIVIHQPNDESLSIHSQMHEGIVSTSLGVPGAPDIAESVMVKRDIELANYTGGKLLIHLLSSEKGVNQIKQAKKSSDGQLFTSVGYHHLVSTEEDLMEFDVNHKIQPPLRSNSDKSALLKAVQSDLIDIICSNHVPIDVEAKFKEFIYSERGALGLQTCGVSLLNILNAETIVQKMSINPRKIFGLDAASIAKGEKAELTLWESNSNFTFDKQANKSRSQNSAFFNKEFDHKIIGIVSKGSLVVSN